jgi:prepilin signal peptidase PulO-like enzyme (type II secretory pathway)
MSAYELGVASRVFILESLGAAFVMSANPIPWIAAIIAVWKHRTLSKAMTYAVLSQAVCAAIIYIVSAQTANFYQPDSWLATLALAAAVSGGLIGIITYYLSSLILLIRRVRIGIGGRSDDKYFDEVAEELESGSYERALWTKALALANGDPQVQRAQYVKLRVAQLSTKDRLRKHQTSLR